MRRYLTVVDPTSRALPAASDYVKGDHFHDQCGVFAVFGHSEAANIAYLGLHALQHRGQESAGIVTSDGEGMYAHRAMGLVQEAFDAAQLKKLPGHIAIGHVRYSTAGGSHIRNAQPFAVDSGRGSLAVCHNGTLTNGDELRATLEASGSIFSSTSDTEVLVHLVARSQEIAIEDRIMSALGHVQGAYSLLFLTTDTVVAVRDPRGIRPLCLGRFLGDGKSRRKKNSLLALATATPMARSRAGDSEFGVVPRHEAYVIASEPTAFDLFGAEYVRDIEPGEMLVINGDGMRSLRLPNPQKAQHCIFEYVYFARPDSSLNGRSVYEVRKELGRTLAKERPAAADVVIAVPDSGVPAAIGYAGALGIPFEMGLIRSHYVGRTFIEPQQTIRHFGVRLKLNPVEPILRGKRVVVLDDSIVRGTTSRKIIKMVRHAGASEVHLRISSPPTKWPCYYGIDTPTRRELIASSHSIDEIARYVTADSVGYLSIEGMLKAVTRIGDSSGGSDAGHYCHACFSGRYAIPFAPPQEGTMSNGKRRLSAV
ncbi:MAG: amidophosphoribosyltransferase [Polyangiaceae bacterium]|nr:amidophosphoribosyltransferase [Polyangiaceae bacterium]